MKKGLRILAIGLCCLLLLLVRGFEDSLFYDPLLEFFRSDYKVEPIPEMDQWALSLGVLFRYMLNSSISIAILWLVFWDKGVIKLSLWIYGILFFVFFVAFLGLINFIKGPENMLVLFYIRRFLIQPLFLLILVPAFYFQKYKAR